MAFGFSRLPNQMSLNRTVLALFSSSLSQPCALGFKRFQALIPQGLHFEAALSELLPVLRRGTDASDVHTNVSLQERWARRIFCAYIIYALYLPHSISINPFTSSLEEITSEISQSIPGTEDAEERALMWSLGICLQSILQDRGSLLDDRTPLQLSLTGIQFSEARPTTKEENPVMSRRPPEIDSSQLRGRSFPPQNGNLDHGDSSVIEKSEDTMSIDQQWANIATAAQSRVITLSEQRIILSGLSKIPPPTLRSFLGPETLASLTTWNIRIATPIISHLLQSPESHPGPDTVREPYLAALCQLHPTLNSWSTFKWALPSSELRRLIRYRVIDTFISNALQIIEANERENPGDVDDEGPTVRAVQLLCKFVRSVLRSDSLSMSSTGAEETETFRGGLDVELTNFALSHSRLTEANALYRLLASRYTVFT
ncbi:hypothetical protein BS47DRAFT_1485122 [Hydnum rufescens UP504]|uniref:CCR4-NOT transcription complex subunit 11 n=1 Tax=Hydnum rufescens UP504 TaxID=1448309 RepID=A0A9P6AYL1_9AGAM|nr:hypothetical protein BS47DRAFT_1485122 [Hydnum rufescens UP504]